MNFGLENEIKKLRAKSLGLNKAQSLKMEKASSDLEMEIKQLRAKISWLDKAHDLKKEKKQALGSKRK